MTIEELRQKNGQELINLLEKQKKELQKITTDILLKKEKNFKKAQKMRRENARINTIINEKKIMSMEGNK